MNKLKKIVVVVLIMSMHSCNCDKKYDCGTLSNEAMSWLNQNQNDSIKYVNALGQHINFFVSAKTVSPAYESQACKHGEAGCSCDYRCEANGRFYATSDSAINNLFNYSLEIIEASTNKTTTTSTLTYSIFDCSNKIDILNPTQLSSGDSLLTSLQLGGANYSNVYIHTLDTLISYNQTKTIWKTYFTKSKGVIGFWVRPTQTLYYRE